jgi:PAS domain-containing protein
VRNHEGKKLGFRGIARDVTEKFETIDDLKKAQRRYEHEFEAKIKARRRTRNLFDFVPYPMVVFSSAGNVTYVNPAFTQVFGWKLEELIGRKIPYFPRDMRRKPKKASIALGKTPQQPLKPSG